MTTTNLAMGKNSQWQEVDGAARMGGPTDYPGVVTPFEDDTAPTSAVEVTDIGNAQVLEIGLHNNDTDGTETVPATKWLFVAFNHAATSELDAAATRRAIPYGETRQFAFTAANPLTKFCYKIDAAPGTGAAVKVHGEYVV